MAPCTILRWERGSQEPYDCHIEALCEFFGVSRQELGLVLPEPVAAQAPRGTAGGGEPVARLPSRAVTDRPVGAGAAASSDQSCHSEPAAPDSDEVDEPPLRTGLDHQAIDAIARQSTQHAVVAGSANLMPATLDQLRADAHRLARSYPQMPPTSLFREMVQARNLTYLTLKRTHRPSQVKDLYLIAGQICGLLALSSLDLGCPDPAADHARAAWSYAEIIDHDGMRAWARGTQAVVAFWSGRAREAVDLATSGQSYARSGGALARLRSLEARAWALIGDAPEARRAIAMSTAFDNDALDEFHSSSSGEFTFSAARRGFCAVASYVQIGDALQAAREAETAIALYSAAPVEGPWYRAEYAARVDLATAHLMQRELDATEDTLTTVFDLPPDRRTARITRRLRQLEDRLAEPPYHSTGMAQRLRERIEHFSAGSAISVSPW